mgnify:CR=1 FL=1
MVLNRQKMNVDGNVCWLSKPLSTSFICILSIPCRKFVGLCRLLEGSNTAQIALFKAVCTVFGASSTPLIDPIILG